MQRKRASSDPVLFKPADKKEVELKEVKQDFIKKSYFEKFTRQEINEIRKKYYDWYAKKYETYLHDWNVKQALLELKTLDDDFFIAAHNNFFPISLILVPGEYKYHNYVLTPHWIYLINVFQQVFTGSDEHIAYRLLEDENLRESVVFYINNSLNKNYCYYENDDSISHKKTPINHLPFFDLELGQLVFASPSNTNYYMKLADRSCFNSDPVAARELFKVHLKKLKEGTSLVTLFPAKKAQIQKPRECGKGCVIL